MDAFAASPFALLDAHGSLRLATDVVHEDDALCLALVCRAMRDALGAPRRPAPVLHLSGCPVRAALSPAQPLLCGPHSRSPPLCRLAKLLAWNRACAACAVLRQMVG